MKDWKSSYLDGQKDMLDLFVYGIILVGWFVLGFRFSFLGGAMKKNL